MELTLDALTICSKNLKLTEYNTEKLNELFLNYNMHYAYCACMDCLDEGRFQPYMNGEDDNTYINDKRFDNGDYDEDDYDEDDEIDCKFMSLIKPYFKKFELLISEDETNEDCHIIFTDGFGENNAQFGKKILNAESIDDIEVQKYIKFYEYLDKFVKNL
jgi:hypothetical protein